MFKNNNGKKPIDLVDVRSMVENAKKLSNSTNEILEKLEHLREGDNKTVLLCDGAEKPIECRLPLSDPSSLPISLQGIADRLAEISSDLSNHVLEPLANAKNNV